MRHSFSFLSEKKYLETQALRFGKKWGLWIWHITSPKLLSRAADPRSTLAEICWTGKCDVRVFNHLTILVSLLNNSSHILPFNSSYMFCAGMQETTTTATTNSPKSTYPRPFNPGSLRNQAPCPLSRLSWPSFASHKKGRRDYFRWMQNTYTLYWITSTICT